MDAARLNRLKFLAHNCIGIASFRNLPRASSRLCQVPDTSYFSDIACKEATDE